MKTLFGFGTVMALAMAATACSKSADSAATLEVTGKVDTQLRTLDNASAIAIGSDGRTFSAYIQKNGSFRLSLPVGKVYRIIFANSTMNGELRTIGHLVNSTSNGKFDEIAVKDGGTMNLGVVRPVGTSTSALHTACNCGSTGSSSGGGGGGSDGEKSGGSDKGGGSDNGGSDKSGGSDGESSDSESGGGDYETKDKDGDKDRLCEDSSDVELEAEHGPGDKCAKDSSSDSAPKPAKKSCSTKDDNHDGKDDDDGEKGGGSGSEGGGGSGGDNAGSSGSSGSADSCSSCAPTPSSCKCSKQCGSGSSCVASKCTPDAAPSGTPSTDTGAGTSSSSGSAPPVN
jgi:hypothetical protein